MRAVQKRACGMLLRGYVAGICAGERGAASELDEGQ